LNLESVEEPIFDEPQMLASGSLAGRSTAAVDRPRSRRNPICFITFHDSVWCGRGKRMFCPHAGRQSRSAFRPDCIFIQPRLDAFLDQHLSDLAAGWLVLAIVAQKHTKDFRFGRDTSRSGFGNNTKRSIPPESNSTEDRRRRQSNFASSAPALQISV
jgi:hypothetical protein